MFRHGYLRQSPCLCWLERGATRRGAEVAAACFRTIAECSCHGSCAQHGNFSSIFCQGPCAIACA
eukprot:6211122-Pleurochrysis_carterae.AAC.2